MAVRFIHLPRFYPSLTIFFPFSYLLRIYTLKKRLQYLINFTIELKHFTNNNYSIIQFLHLHSYYHFIRYIYILIISYVYKLLSTHIYISYLPIESSYTYTRSFHPFNIVYPRNFHARFSKWIRYRAKANFPR